ncbi:Response regulator receiver domain-containing protein [Desulfocicer vacuolatum DSM 3385]|uniref:Response regulator receiver domain-containing protein n=1 Tax=Desulfocicer vacuolatum DSM 3385 TaxID=1121400 RepID=A0A1W2DRG6_9BACT|nr:response regulator [Desulfocicer vacuolatum]SMC99586.1 Response regulator receiver domain-containing protein [Desulfocicer vacuolatum DSM 3385]
MKQINLLMVDDEKGFLDTIIKRLKKRDVNVSGVYSGKEALAFLDKNKNVEVVILDVKMPGMDGMETLIEIKKQCPLVEVIMLTGHATVETAIDGMKMGAFDYLMKPCDINVLISKVEEAVAKKKAHEDKITEARIKEITQRMA